MLQPLRRLGIREDDSVAVYLALVLSVPRSTARLPNVSNALEAGQVLLGEGLNALREVYDENPWRRLRNSDG